MNLKYILNKGNQKFVSEVNAILSLTVNNDFYAYDFLDNIKPCFRITKISPYITEVGTSIYSIYMVGCSIYCIHRFK